MSFATGSPFPPLRVALKGPVAYFKGDVTHGFGIEPSAYDQDSWSAATCARSQEPRAHATTSPSSVLLRKLGRVVLSDLIRRRRIKFRSVSFQT